MIKRLLIANRGEIVVRVAGTAFGMGIDTVGIYSESDANALHVDCVDIAVAIGGSTAAESYLRADSVVNAALDTGCDAIHPGYGFLAENAAFAQQVIDAGLVWVGPTPDQISLLGDKVAAKRVAAEAGVPTTAVYEIVDGIVSDGVTFPALVKAAAGGGGRGMRVVRSADELEAAVEAASREALSAFGNGTVFIEPYIESGRHIEVQIIGDSFGNVVHLGERECSIQRRNQKVIEEAPSPSISQEVRQTLLDAAVALGNRVGYQSAGTVEFLVGADDSITFLEVNTRLQVEHPVTEAVTGLDLVEFQLRVAAGEPLKVKQEDVRTEGHAIEVRIVAEDPSQDWLPSTGLVDAFDIYGAFRIHTGVRPGSVISPDYDSLLAKVISHGPTRDFASRQLAQTLRRGQITGVATNVATLVAILEEDDFVRGATPTSYLDDHPEVLHARGASGDELIALLLGAVFARERRDRELDPVTNFAPSGWRNLRTQGQRQYWIEGQQDHFVEYILAGNSADVRLGPWPEPLDDGSLEHDERRRLSVRLLDRTDEAQVVEIDGRRHRIDVRSDASTVHTSSARGSASFTLAPRFEERDAEQSGAGPISPLPGRVIAVHVEVGQTVGAGDLLVVVEAMKMEHRITAESDSVVDEVRFEVGDRVDAGELLILLAQSGDSQ